MSIEKLSEVWSDWEVVELLGEGAFGKVYKIQREEHGVRSTAAVKVISIPQNDAELATMRSEGLDESATHTYFEGIVTDFVSEIKLMQSMKGTSNIVSVEDYKVLENTEKIGWNIFIRMELLTPLNDYIADKSLTEAEIIKLGQDVCSALELCSKKNIIHRDIKPENIFVSSFGDFKVGDFGIARELEKTSASLSQKGTYNYIAPEVITSKNYDASVDIYSLGLVLYKLMNNNRLPFLDPNAQLIQYKDRKNAIDRRLSGDALPPPINASQRLSQVILTACAFDPAERFLIPTAFKNALGAIMGEKPSPVPSGFATVPINRDSDETSYTKLLFDGVKDVETQTDINATANESRETKSAEPIEEPEEVQDSSIGKKKRLKKPIILVASLLFVVAIGLCLFLINPGGIFDGIIGDPAEEVVAALIDGNHADALALAEGVEDYALQDRLSERLDVLLANFIADEIEYSVAIMELDTIERMNVSGLSTQISNIRESVNNINASRIAFNTAESMFNNGDYVGAMAQYRLVILDDPNFNAAQEGMNRALGGYRSQIAGIVDRYTTNGDYGGAIRTLRDALRMVQNDPELAQMLNIVEQNHISVTISEAASLLARDRHYEATAVINAALQITPDEMLLADKLAEINHSYVTIAITEAATLLGEGNHSEASSVISNALNTVPDDGRLISKQIEITSSYVATVIAEADALLAEGNHSEASAVISNALNIAPDDERLVSKQTEIAHSYVTISVAQASELLAQFEHNAANDVINSALQVVPGNQQLLDMSSQIAGTRPVSVRDLTSIQDRFISSSVTRDNFQNEYNDVVQFNERAGTFVSLLDSRYTRLRGTLFIAYGTNETGTRTVTFRLDGRVIETHTLGRTTRPIEIDIDLSDGNDFRIDTTVRTQRLAPRIYFADFSFYPAT